MVFSSIETSLLLNVSKKSLSPALDLRFVSEMCVPVF